MLIPITATLLSAGFSFLAIVLMARDGMRNGLLVVTITFVLFAYGPLVNIATGNTFYEGINLQFITQPVIGFGLAVAGILVAHLFVPLREERNDATPRPHYPLLTPLLLATASYGALLLVRLLPLIGGNKLSIIAAAGPGHYPYLLLQIFAVGSLFLCRSQAAKRIWFFNFAIYLAYNLATAERDFLFVTMAVLVHREFFLKKRRSLRFSLLAIAAAVGGTMLAAARQATGGGSLWSSILNQAPILFIDSHITERVPQSISFAQGQTYWDAALRPMGATDAQPLASWFVSWYAPTSASGYGFSLTGEAFMNFGLAGVPCIFFLLALTQRALMNASQRRDAPAFLSVVFLSIWIYALRGDSSQIFSTMIYAIVFVIVITSVRSPTSTVRKGFASRARVTHMATAE